MISAVHFPTFNYGRDILAMVLYERATGTPPLMGETAGMVVAGILRQPPDTVGLRLIVLNQKAYGISPVGPGITGSVYYSLLRIRRQIYETNFPHSSSRRGFTRHIGRLSRSSFGRHND